MKSLTSLALAAVILIAACNNNKPKENNTTTNIPTTTTTQPGNDMAKLMEELKKKPALSTDQLKALLPEELAGMKRASFSTNSMLGYGIGEATYKSDDGKEMRLTIYDCVGEAGVGWYNMMYWGMNMESQDDNGYKKTVTLNGNKAIESYEKNQDSYSLMFPSSNRLLVNLEGDKTGLDAVQQAAQSLNLKVE